jgi:Protein of unknown function (DUF1579)
MKLFILSACLLLANLHTNAQQTDPWTAYMMPSKMHDILKEYSGDFNMEITMWMTAGEAPMIANVQSKNKMILGGRFLEMVQTGKMMEMDYQSVTTIGFNNSNNNLGLTTLNNMGTGTLFLSGMGSDTSKIINITGRMTNPVDKKVITIRQQINFISKNILLIENFDTYEGEKERKSMQYKLTRIQ